MNVIGQIQKGNMVSGYITAWSSSYKVYFNLVCHCISGIFTYFIFLKNPFLAIKKPKMTCTQNENKSIKQMPPNWKATDIQPRIKLKNQISPTHHWVISPCSKSKMRNPCFYISPEGVLRVQRASVSATTKSVPPLKKALLLWGACHCPWKSPGA